MAPQRKKKRRSAKKVSLVKHVKNTFKTPNYNKEIIVTENKSDEVVLPDNSMTNKVLSPKSGKEDSECMQIVKTVRPTKEIEIVVDENVLNADFIPFASHVTNSRGPKSGYFPPHFRKIHDTVMSSSISGSGSDPLTITVDDDDDEGNNNVKDSNSDSISIDESNKCSDSILDLNESIQIINETVNKKHDKCIGCLNRLNDATDVQISSQSKKRKFDDSIEILDTCTYVSNRSKRKKRNGTCESIGHKCISPDRKDVLVSAQSSKEIDDSIEILDTCEIARKNSQKRSRNILSSKGSSSTVSNTVLEIANRDKRSLTNHKPDDDIVIVDTVDNSSRDSVIVLNDPQPSKASSGCLQDKDENNKEKLVKRCNQQQGRSTSIPCVFVDNVGHKKKSFHHYKSPLPRNLNEDCANVSYHNVYGNNMYNPNSVQKIGLRPVVIDGSNVAFAHGGNIFSTRGIEICVNYFLKRGHWVMAFVPRFRRSEVCEADKRILDHLQDGRHLAFTPSRFLHGRRVASYDDRFIVQCAAELGGVVVSTDNYRDLVCENEAWRETIEKRLLMFTWVGDILMFPDDPNGRGGPRLEEFLRFPK